MAEQDFLRSPSFNVVHSIRVQNPKSEQIEEIRGTIFETRELNALIGDKPDELTLVTLSEDGISCYLIAEKVSEYRDVYGIYLYLSQKQWWLKLGVFAEPIKIGEVDEDETLLIAEVFGTDEETKVAICLQGEEKMDLTILIFDCSGSYLEHTIKGEPCMVVDENYLVHFNVAAGGWLLYRSPEKSVELGEYESFGCGLRLYKKLDAEMQIVLRIEPNLEDIFVYSEYGVYRDVNDEHYLIGRCSDGLFDFFDVEGEKVIPPAEDMTKHYRRFNTFASPDAKYPTNVKIYKWDVEFSGFKVLYEGSQPDKGYFYNAIILPINVVGDVQLINLDSAEVIAEGHWEVIDAERAFAFSVRIGGRVWQPVDASDQELCRFLDFK